MFPKVDPGDRSDVCPIDLDGTAFDIIETHQQVDQRGLAGTGRPDDGDPLSGLNLNVEILDENVVIGITEINMIETDCTVDLDLNRIKGIFYLIGFIDEFKKRVRQKPRSTARPFRCWQPG